MSDRGITKNNLLSALPRVLASDAKMQALCSVIAEAAVSNNSAIGLLKIYGSIGTLPETLLDILAKDFNVKWWVGDMTLAEKRSVFAKTWDIYRMIGTKKAVEDAVSAIYDGAQVVEWWEYSAQPFHFKVYIDSSYQGFEPEKYAQIISKVKYYKNLRSIFDGVEFADMGATASGYYFAGVEAYAITDSGTASR